MGAVLVSDPINSSPLKFGKACQRGVLEIRHSRMLLAGIQRISDWTPDQNVRGDDLDGCGTQNVPIFILCGRA
jgi:hypothetical protein